MSANILTFDEFVASKVWHDDGDGESGLEGPGYSYAGCCHINSRGDGPYRRFYLTIENHGWESPEIVELERELYFGWYLDEVCGE